jgi:hypothetical protein
MEKVAGLQQVSRFSLSLSLSLVCVCVLCCNENPLAALVLQRVPRCIREGKNRLHNRAELGPELLLREGHAGLLAEGHVKPLIVHAKVHVLRTSQSIRNMHPQTAATLCL